MTLVRKYDGIGTDFHNPRAVNAFSYGVNLTADKNLLSDNTADFNAVSNLTGRVFNAGEFQLTQAFFFFAFTSFFGEFALAFRFNSGQTLLLAELQEQKVIGR